VTNVTSAANYTLYTIATNDFIPRPIAFLSTVDNYTVNLINGSVSITPSTINIAQGSCQSVNLTLGTSPSSNVTVTVYSTDPANVYIQNSTGTNTTVFTFTNAMN
jgi:hypothetical protein